MKPTGNRYLRAPLLAELRVAAGLTQKQLAAKAGHGYVTISRLERDGQANIGTVQDLARALDVSVDVLTGREPLSKKIRKRISQA